MQWLSEDVAWLVWSLSWTANIEGYAEYLEEAAVRAAFPLSHFLPHADSGAVFADTPLGQAQHDVMGRMAQRAGHVQDDAQPLIRALDRVARRVGRDWYRARQTSKQTSRFKPNAAKRLASQVATAAVPVLLDALDDA